MENRIRLEPEELKAIQMSLQTLFGKIQEVSDGGYVTKNLFSKSQGTSVDAMNQVLAVLVECAQQMKAAIEKTDNYLEDILEEFVTLDKTWAAKLNLGEYLK